jgi:DNA-binding beta-propeller fold protein YncE
VWGTKGSANGQFQQPGDVALAPDGDWVYVVDAGNNRVQKFSIRGTFVAAWGTEGTGEGQFQAPGAIAVDADEFIYVTDTATNRIQKFNSSGAFRWEADTGLGADN